MDSCGGGSRHCLWVARNTQAKIHGNISKPGKLAHTSMLELSLTEVVNREVVRDTKRIKTNISNITLTVFGGRKERDGLRLFSSNTGSRTAYLVAQKRRQNYRVKSQFDAQKKAHLTSQQYYKALTGRGRGKGGGRAGKGSDNSKLHHG